MLGDYLNESERFKCMNIHEQAVLNPLGCLLNIHRYRVVCLVLDKARAMGMNGTVCVL